MMQLKKFFNNKRVLITGDTGFCGSWLTIFLSLLGANIHGLSLYDRNKNIFHDHVKKLNNYFPHYCNIFNKKKTYDYIKKVEPNIIFHLAAQPLVLDSYKNFRKTLNTNVMGTYNIIDGSKDIKNLEQIIVITTDKVYFDFQNNIPFRENMPLGGIDPYSASKSMTEILCHSFSKSIIKDKFYLGTARGGNIIGGGDFSKNRIIPDIVNKILIKNQKLIIRNPMHIRPWQHVFSLCYGYILFSYNVGFNSKIKDENSFNFGPDNKKFYNVKNVVDMFLEEYAKISGHNFLQKINIDNKNQNKVYESEVLKLDSRKANKMLKWKPMFSTKQAINETANWYYNYLNDRDNILKYSIKEVSDFIDLA